MAIQIKYRELKNTPYDKRFRNVLTGQDELCHPTGFEACDVGMDSNKAENWWNEYIDSSGSLHYGR